MWNINFVESARKELRKLDHKSQSDILKYLRTRIALAQNPCDFGKSLSHEYKGLWRYRIGDYRMICRIEESTISILVLRIGHRRDIYD